MVSWSCGAWVRTLVVAGSFGFAATTVACKEAPKPRPLPSPSAPAPASQPLGAAAPAVDPRCSQVGWVCTGLTAELVALCNEKETDKVPCNDKAWTQTLYDRMVGLQSGQVELENCTATTLYVNTQQDELLLRDKPDLAGTVIGDGPRGTSVTCVGVAKGTEWTKVKLPSGQEGFMNSKYLSATKPAGSGTAGGGAGGPCKDPDGDGFCVCWRFKYEGQRPVDIRGFDTTTKCTDLNNRPFYPMPGLADSKRTTVGCVENPGFNAILRDNDCLCTIRLRETQSVAAKTCPQGWRSE